jgi:hypothetical protein
MQIAYRIIDRRMDPFEASSTWSAKMRTDGSPQVVTNPINKPTGKRSRLWGREPRASPMALPKGRNPILTPIRKRDSPAADITVPVRMFLKFLRGNFRSRTWKVIKSTASGNTAIATLDAVARSSSSASISVTAIIPPT